MRKFIMGMLVAWLVLALMPDRKAELPLLSPMDTGGVLDVLSGGVRPRFIPGDGR